MTKSEEKTRQLNQRNKELCRIIQKAENNKDAKLQAKLDAARKDAEEELYQLNESFIFLVIHKMAYLMEFDYSFEDMRQHGAIGLIKASTRYKEDAGASFISYAFNYIRKEIYEGYAPSHGNIYVPSLADEKRIKFCMKHHIQITDANFYDILAADPDLSENDRETIKYAAQARSYVSYEAIESALSDTENMPSGKKFATSSNWASYNGQSAPNTPFSSNTFHIANKESAETVEELAIKSILKDTCDEVLEMLPARLEWIIRKRLMTNPPYTLAECGKRCPYGQLSAERVRQLEKEALTILQSAPSKKKLHAYWA